LTEREKQRLIAFVVCPGKDAVGVGGDNVFSGTTLSTEANEPGHSGSPFLVHF